MSSSILHEKKRSFLDGLTTVFRGAPAPTGGDSVASKFRTSAREVDSALKNLKTVIEQQEANEAARSGKRPDSAGDGRTASVGPNAQQLQEQELERSIQKMRSEILGLHARLNTGITEQSLAETESYLSELLDELKGQDLDARLRAATAERLNRELGPIAWHVLQRRMEIAGTEWPKPSGLLPNAGEEERARAREDRVVEAQALFLNHNLEKTVKGMGGVVTAWKRYPDASSSLWREVVFRGAAEGIRGRLMVAAVDKLRSDIEELHSTANEMLSDAMVSIQSLLQAGVHSLEDAQKIVHGTDTVVHEALPSLAWQHAKPAVEQSVAQFLGK